MWKEFKEFATKGNVIDLAIGVIIGGGFQKIVTSLVNDIIMPVVSIFTGKIDFNDMIIIVGNTSIKYGSFITNVINFLVIAFCVFLMVRYINKLNQKLETTAKSLNQKLERKPLFFKKKTKEKQNVSKPTTKTCPYCMSEINIQASRCPNCTSVLTEERHEELVGEQLEIKS